MRVEFLPFKMAFCFVVGVLHIGGLGNFVVVVVYFPSHESGNAPGKYCDVLDSLSEAVGRRTCSFPYHPRMCYLLAIETCISCVAPVGRLSRRSLAIVVVHRVCGGTT